MKIVFLDQCLISSPTHLLLPRIMCPEDLPKSTSHPSLQTPVQQRVLPGGWKEPNGLSALQTGGLGSIPTQHYLVLQQHQE